MRKFFNFNLSLSLIRIEMINQILNMQYKLYEEIFNSLTIGICQLLSLRFIHERRRAYRDARCQSQHVGSVVIHFAFIIRTTYQPTRIQTPVCAHRHQSQARPKVKVFILYKDFVERDKIPHGTSRRIAGRGSHCTSAAIFRSERLNRYILCEHDGARLYASDEGK